MRGSGGQAGVEAVLVLPVLVLVAAVGLQVLLWAAAAVVATAAAGEGARAAGRGDDAQAAARASLPGALRDGAVVEREDGAVVVRVRVPPLVPVLGGRRVEGSAR